MSREDGENVRCYHCGVDLGVRKEVPMVKWAEPGAERPLLGLSWKILKCGHCLGQTVVPTSSS